ncbi:MAG: hypothetical protein WD071_15870 [Pseudohongiella sp.]|uniref:hypothetical protein n=1 Tax=Pseudohongiella sp. TaxID=1979412 RepID=UPI0034A0662C
MKIIIKAFFLLSIVLSGQAMAYSSYCSTGGGFAPYIRHYATYSPWDYSLFAPGGAHRASSNIFTPVVDYDELAEYMTSGGGDKTLQLFVPSFGTWSFDGKSELGYGEHSAFVPATYPSICSDSLSFEEVNTSITMSPSNTVTEGTTVTATWSGGGSADYCVVLGQTYIGNQNSLTFTTVQGDSGTYVVWCYNEHDSDDASITLTVDPAPPSCPAVPPPAVGFVYPNPSRDSNLPTSEFGGFNFLTPPGQGVNVQAYCDNDVWRARVAYAAIPTRIAANLHELEEVSVNRVNSESSCTVLNQMASSLTYHSSFTTGPRDTTTNPFWMIDAIVAHENVHYEKFKDSLDPYFSDFLVDMHNVTIPIGSAANASSARAQMESQVQAVYELLRQDMVIARSFADHPPVAWSLFTSASLAVSGNRVSNITARKNALSCAL